MKESPPVCRASLQGSILRLTTRPGQAWGAVVAVVLLMLALGRFVMANPEQPGRVLAGLAVGGFLLVALVGAIGAVRSYYLMDIDLAARTIHAEEVRMYSRRLVWDGSLDEVEVVEFGGRQMRVLWHDRDTPAITAVFTTEVEAQEARAALDGAVR